MKTKKNLSKLILAGIIGLVLTFGLVMVSCETLDDFMWGYSQGRGWTAYEPGTLDKIKPEANTEQTDHNAFGK
ncbi:MAG: hypothetical protein LBN21_05060 [Treponema sp.]|jgi:hypothetical protein|nr:hypothetical protein [Treponema sp.]